MPGVGSTRKTSQPKRNGVKENERERERKGKVVTLEEEEGQNEADGSKGGICL